MLSTSTSSEEDRRSAEPTPQGEEAAERASDPRERAVDLAGEEEDNYSPRLHSLRQIQLQTPRIPRRKWGQHREERWWWSLLKERLPGAKRTQW